MKDLVALDELKSFAYNIGTVAAGSYTDVLAWVFKKKKKVVMMADYGDLWEVVVLFVMGVFARSAKERHRTFWVLTDPELDKNKIDLQINHYSIQLKFGWDEGLLEGKRMALSHKRITLVNAPYPEPCNPLNILKEILRAARFSDREIMLEEKENPAFKAMSECWVWFLKGIV